MEFWVCYTEGFDGGYVDSGPYDSLEEANEYCREQYHERPGVFFILEKIDE